MDGTESEFSEWLGQKLRALNTDDGVFGSYIQGILDGDESNDEKIEALEGILSEIVESDITQICKEIMDKWAEVQEQKSKQTSTLTSENVDEKLVRLLESQTLATTVQRQYTAEERRLKDAILNQYGQMSDDEEDGEDGGGGGGKTSGGGDDGGGSQGSGGLKPNINALLVQQAEKEKREQARLDAQKKKEKDKEDREKQKQMREEKKEKRKTVKGERKR